MTSFANIIKNEEEGCLSRGSFVKRLLLLAVIAAGVAVLNIILYRHVPNSITSLVTAGIQLTVYLVFFSFLIKRLNDAGIKLHKYIYYGFFIYFGASACIDGVGYYLLKEEGVSGYLFAMPSKIAAIGLAIELFLPVVLYYFFAALFYPTDFKKKDAAAKKPVIEQSKSRNIFSLVYRNIDTDHLSRSEYLDSILYSIMFLLLVSPIISLSILLFDQLLARPAAVLFSLFFLLPFILHEFYLGAVRMIKRMRNIGVKDPYIPLFWIYLFPLMVLGFVSYSIILIAGDFHFSGFVVVVAAIYLGLYALSFIAFKLYLLLAPTGKERVNTRKLSEIYPSLKRRIAAKFCDNILILLLSAAAFVLFFFLMRDYYVVWEDIAGGEWGMFMPASEYYLFIQANIAFFLATISALYEVIFLLKWSKTPGKMLFNIIVRKKNGETINYQNIFFRNILVVIAASLSFLIFLSLYFEFMSDDAMDFFELAVGFVQGLSGIVILVGLFTIALTKQKRALHDFYGGTVVMKESKVDSNN